MALPVRITREYSLRPVGVQDNPDRGEFDVECCETRYCEDPACEAGHDDPTVKWDTRTYYSVASVHGRERADRVIAGLRCLEPDHAAVEDLLKLMENAGRDRAPTPEARSRYMESLIGMWRWGVRWTPRRQS